MPRRCWAAGHRMYLAATTTVAEARPCEATVIPAFAQHHPPRRIRLVVSSLPYPPRGILLAVSSPPYPPRSSGVARSGRDPLHRRPAAGRPCPGRAGAGSGVPGPVRVPAQDAAPPGVARRQHAFLTDALRATYGVDFAVMTELRAQGVPHVQPDEYRLGIKAKADRPEHRDPRPPGRRSRSAAREAPPRPRA